MSFHISLDDARKLHQIASRVYKNCRDCTGNYKAFTGEARNLTNLLEDISDKYDCVPHSKRQQLANAYDLCLEVLEELDKTLLHYNGLDTMSKRSWDRLECDPEKLNALREQLTSSATVLDEFYTALIKDGQVLILQALDQLEKDYRSGCREESIPSIEQIAYEAAIDEAGINQEPWLKFVEDLKDVGISQRDAFNYRELIVDWVVRAMEDGRLTDKRPASQDLDTTHQDVPEYLPVITAATQERMHSSESPSSSSAIPAAFLPRQVHHQDTHNVPPQDEVDGHLVCGRDNEPPAYTNTGSRDVAEKIPETFMNTSSMSGLSRQERTDPPSDGQGPFTMFGSTLGYEKEQSKTTAIASSSNEPAEPPAYDDLITAKHENLLFTAQRIAHAWEEREFVTAEGYLENQLAAVENGASIVVNGRFTRPDQRVLRHAIGVCASYSGSFHKAKRMFESVIRSTHLNRSNLDDGDIAAARWLGDVCLQLNEPTNTAFAWALALHGLMVRYGPDSTLTVEVYQELKMLDHWFDCWKKLTSSFAKGIDTTDIFMDSYAMEKPSLVKSVHSWMNPSSTKLLSSIIASDWTMRQQSSVKFARGRADWRVMEIYLAQPLVASSQWPLPYDPTFLLEPAIILQRHIYRPLSPSMPIGHYPYDFVPSAGLGGVKNLDFATKRSAVWLVETLKDGLSRLGVEYMNHGTDFLCRITQQCGGFVYHEGYWVKIKKAPLRNMYGVKVSEGYWQTRGLPTLVGQLQSLEMPGATGDFGQRVRDMLETAHDETRGSLSEKSSKS
ncbi:hypothetical protein BS50DRAFT_137919 [Corynespora cassiicola Philippines]|uniref:Uncharacterized protein n=1 Tax=Corynespora cassiicola Philippines TaxID=1448308 RepID=A0A2T2N9T9_CORCC|nr:hypothetical protein BS50DRAFT_137919 [Corynespora cassiicola Philippines]